jgi:hypothetical protein
MGSPGPTGSQIWSSFVPIFVAPYTIAALTPDNGIEVTRIQVQVGIGPSKCTTNAVLTISDGTTSENLTISGLANDSGPIALNYAAGAHLLLSVSTPSRCSVLPAAATVVVQYKVH